MPEFSISKWWSSANPFASPSTPIQATFPFLKGQVITVLPGHGGEDSGATAGSFKEKDFTLAAALALKKELELYGATVYLSREKDEKVSKITQAEFANQKNSHVVIAIHFDSYIRDKSVSGTRIYYHRTADALLAKAINTAILQVFPNRKGRIEVGDFHVLQKTTAPTLLVEWGYLSNNQDRLTMTAPHFNQKLARAITGGIHHYLKTNSQGTFNTSAEMENMRKIK